MAYLLILLPLALAAITFATPSNRWRPWLLPLGGLIHLAIVLALFVSLPYGKFVHGIYRAAALVRCAMEEHSGGESQSAGQR